jgi:hypothetical protein
MGLLYLYLYLFYPKPEQYTVICSLSRRRTRGKKKGGDVYRPTKNTGN